MKLILLYGPPAVGKLTIAQILERQTGYILLHNHLLVNPIAQVFPFENPANRTLVREFRLRILEEALKSDINLIMTFGIAGNTPNEHIPDLLTMVESHGGIVTLVHLTADNETILRRVEDQSRREQGKNLSKKRLEELLTEHPDMFDRYPEKKHLSIDTSKVTPKQAADMILASIERTK